MLFFPISYLLQMVYGIVSISHLVYLFLFALGLWPLYSELQQYLFFPLPKKFKIINNLNISIPFNNIYVKCGIFPITELTCSSSCFRCFFSMWSDLWLTDFMSRLHISQIIFSRSICFSRILLVRCCLLCNAINW